MEIECLDRKLKWTTVEVGVEKSDKNAVTNFHACSKIGIFNISYFELVFLSVSVAHITRLQL